MNALDKKQRRKVRRQIKQSGADPMKLLLPAQAVVGERVVTGDRLYVTEVVAEFKCNKLQQLNKMIDNGGSEGIAAAKAKRSMNTRWENRNTNTSRGYFRDVPAGNVTSINPEGYVFNN